MGTINFTAPQDGETADASDVVTPLQTIYNEFNGEIDNDNIASDAAIARSKIATSTTLWEELARTTLSGAGDTISVTSITARRYLRVIVSARDTGGTIGFLARFNNDTSANYARRYSVNGAADTTETSQTSILVGSVAVAGPMTSDVFIDNFGTDEKTVLFHAGSASTAGAGNAPSRVEGSGKWVNTSDQITRIDIVNNGSGDFAIGSEVVVLGHD